MASKPKFKPKRRGYDYGGQVLSTDSLGRSITGGFMSGLKMGSIYNDLS